MSSDTPTLVEVIRLALDQRQRAIHTALPGRVLTYDRAKQAADIELQIEMSVPKRGGGRVYEKLPTLHSVPIGHPRGGGFFVHFPLQAGDFVWVMFAERSMDEFTKNGRPSKPKDIGMHDLSFAYAIPASSPATIDKLPVATTPDWNGLTIGREGESEPDFVLDGDGNITINGNLSVGGNIEAGGDVEAGGEVSADGLALSTHIHSGVTPGGGVSGGPQSPPP